MSIDYISRDDNKLADVLAKEAALIDYPNEPERFKIVMRADRIINKVKISPTQIF